MAADVGRDVVGPEFPLHQFHGREDWPLRAADTEARRTRRYNRCERLDLVAVQDGWLVRRAQMIGNSVGCEFGEKSADAFSHDRGGVLAGHRQQVLAREPGLNVGPA